MGAAGAVTSFARMVLPAALLVGIDSFVWILLKRVKYVFMTDLADGRPNVSLWSRRDDRRSGSGCGRFSVLARIEAGSGFCLASLAAAGFASGGRGLSGSSRWPAASMRKAIRNRIPAIDMLILRMHLVHRECRSRAVTHHATLAKRGGVRKGMRRHGLDYVAADTRR